MKKDSIVKNSPEPMLSQSALINDYGWTKTLIERHLPEPTTKTNPLYQSAAPMKLWKKADVEAAMETPEFKADWEKSQKRREGAKKAAETKRKALMSSISVDYVFPPLEYARELAFDFIRERNLQRDDYLSEPEDAPIETQNRWIVNTLRHEFTTYNYDVLRKSKGKVGKNAAIETNKKMILRAIAEHYPSLADECKNQLNKIDFLKGYRAIFHN